MEERESLVGMLHGAASVAVGLGAGVGVIGLWAIAVGMQDFEGWGLIGVVIGGAIMVVALMWSLPHLALARRTAAGSPSRLPWVMTLLGAGMFWLLSWVTADIEWMMPAVPALAGGLLVVEAVLGAALWSSRVSRRRV